MGTSAQGLWFLSCQSLGKFLINEPIIHCMQVPASSLGSSPLTNPRVGEPGAHAIHTSLEATQGSWPDSHVPLFSCQNKLFV